MLNLDSFKMETFVNCMEGLEDIILRMNKNHRKTMRKWHDMLYFEKQTLNYIRLR